MAESVLPKPVNELIIDYTSFQGGVERWYFWLLDYLKEDLGYDVKKLEDKFIASEASTFWVTLEQRKATQQEKAMTYVVHIGNMTKSIFQILRELRIMDERWDYYKRSKAGQDSAEVALKALWVDMVEGGGKNVNSVTGLATQVGFVTLPDFFFSVHPKSVKDVDRVVEKVDANQKLKEVLKRKLFQYLAWKENTEREITTRRKFVLKSLRQHFNTIKLYIEWIKPYLKNVSKLQPGETAMNEELITAAETAIIDLEILGVKWKKEKIRKGGKLIEVKKRYHPCIQLKFHFRTVPEMMFQQEYQRAPVHVGKSVITFRAYALSNEQIREHQKGQDKDTIDMITSMNASLEALKEDLNKYLIEAAEQELIGGKKEELKDKGFIQTMAEPFTSVIISFFGIKKKETKKEPEKEKPPTWKDKLEKASLAGGLKGDKGDMWLLYDVFKKAHGMATW